MKWTPGVYFINILHAPFCMKANRTALYFLAPKILCEKRARKMLMKLTPGFNFINIFAHFFVQNFGAKAKT